MEITKEAIFHYNRELMGLLLRDRTPGKNIIWSTDEYEQYGYGYGETDEITVDLAVIRHGSLIYPRIFKTILVSRYDSVTGEKIPVKERIGMLDRKLRVVSGNCHSEEKWLRFARKAFQSVYGFEYQGDNLLIARINLLSTFVEYYQDKFTKPPADHWLRIIADTITWNLWQMDGLKAVVPLSCRKEHHEQMSLYGTEAVEKECPGCQQKDIHRHNGLYCQIMDWSG